MTESNINYQELAEKIKFWGKELGFDDIGFSDLNLTEHEQIMQNWLVQNYHGEMDYLARNGELRADPAKLVPGTMSVISVRMNYLPSNAQFATTLKNKEKAYVSRYALGRDYHKLMRKRLKQLGEKIKGYCNDFQYRPFVDSAPVLERPLAEKAGLGWTGKHTLVINKEAGSWFFLGELLVNIPLPTSTPVSNDCGNCVACIKICPTQAIVEPYVVDARRCISYLTIELREAIPIEFRPLIGNRIYGCDDCQLICPWNKFAQLSVESDFQARQQLDSATLLDLFTWSEQEFLSKTEGSPIRRIGFECWQRNIAVAIGNGEYSQQAFDVLNNALHQVSDMVDEHILWAIKQLERKKKSPNDNVNERLTLRLVRSIEKGLPRDA